MDKKKEAKRINRGLLTMDEHLKKREDRELEIYLKTPKNKRKR
jgi:hypothetical protein